MNVSDGIVTHIITMLQDDHWAKQGIELWQSNKPYLTREQSERIEQAASQVAEQQADPLRFLHYPQTFTWEP